MMNGASVRFFTTFGGCIGLDELSCSLEDELLQLEAGTEQLWERLLLKHRKGHEIALIERYDVIPFGAGVEIIRECVKEIRGKKPILAAHWLAGYLQRVLTIYAFQPLGGARIDNGWRELESIAVYVWQEHGGVFQTPEGFTNEWGHHILLQQPDTSQGPRWLGLLNPDGGWMHFRMDIANRKQREQFLLGELPEGVESGDRGYHDPFEHYNPFECT
jgi:hypothetical protein